MSTYDQQSDALVLECSNTLKTQLVSMWERILDIDSIDEDDQFLHLGGNSLEAIQIVAEIEKIFSIRVPVVVIFQCDTIEKLAAYLEKERPQTIQATPMKASTKKQYMLSDLQKSFYFIQQAQGAQAFVYNIPLVLTITGSLDPIVLSGSLAVLIDRHAILHSIFYEGDQGLVQELVEHGTNTISLLPEPITQAQLPKKIKALINTTIPLNKFPLLRAKLFKCTANKHVLVIVQPHMITDGWSSTIIKEELFSYYSALIAKRTPNLPPLKMSYFEYIQETQDKLNSEVHTRDIDYWKSKLANIKSLNFPHDNARTENTDFSGRRQVFSIKKALFEQLNHFSAKQNVTPFMLVATIMNSLLARYCGQDDIVLGFPISSRNQVALERTLGPLINTLVLRTQVDSNKTFIELLQQVKENCLEAYAHQTTTFNTLVNHLKIERVPGMHPIFQIMLVWQDWYEAVIHPTDTLRVQSELIDQETAKFDLSFEFIPIESGLECFIEYNSSLFQPETIERLSCHFLDLLEQCIASPGVPLSRIALKCSPQTRAITPMKTSAVPEAMMARMPHHVFEEQVKKTPSNIAVIFQDNRINYAELNKRANLLAHYIRSNYLQSFLEEGCETPFIGIFLHKSVELVVSILAILKAGAAYVPIDTRSPPKRIQFILADANCQLVITQSAHKSLFQSDQTLLCLDQAEIDIAQCDYHNMPMLRWPDDPIYIIYTSGTTGYPKGVIQTYVNVACLFFTTANIFQFSEADTWLLFHSHAFDFSVWELWGAMLYGGQLVIPTEQDISNPDAICELIKRHEISVLNQTPSAFKAFMQIFKERHSDLATLNYIIFGGEKLDSVILSDWWQQFTDVRPQMVNMYGITETTVHTTYKILSKHDLVRSQQSNIGVPLDNMSVLVVDQHKKPLPIGIPGELLVGGHGLATGYLNQPELTRKKFIMLSSNDLYATDKPSVSDDKSMRFYCTGDLVRYLSDGSLEYLGRIDQQIQFRGFRIEKEGIESILQQFPLIAQAAILLKTYKGAQKLVAYYTLNGADNPKQQDLQLFLKQRLPSYMLPNLWIKLTHIPLTAQMKTDYTNLAAMEDTPVGIASEFQKPIAVLQQLLAVIWEEALNLKHIGLDDNFFSIGGDSITSLRVIAKAREKGFSLSVGDMYKYQTIRSMVDHGCKKDSTQATLKPKHYVPLSMLQEKDRAALATNCIDAYPMSSLQLGMLYHTYYEPNSAVYLDVFGYTIDSVYQHNCLVKAFESLISTNPILRTTFHLQKYSEPLQVVHTHITPLLDVKDLSDYTPIEQNKKRIEWTEQQKKQPFNQEQGPLFRITVHLLSDNLFHLGFAFHHAILDGWSVASCITSLLSLYAKNLEGKSSAPSINEHYQKFIALEQKAVSSKIQKYFWKQYLADYEPTHIARWFEQDPGTDDFVTYSLHFDPQLTVKLLALSKKLHVSIDAVLLTAFIKLLSVLTNSKEVLTGVVFNGRPSVDGIEDTLGLFLNSLPFRQVLIEGSWSDLILAIFRKKAEIYPHRRYPLMQIQKDLDSKQLFDTLFYFTHFHVYKKMQSSNGVNIVAQDFYERTNFPLACNVTLDPLQDELTLFIDYETKCYQEEQIQQFSDYFIKILNTISHQADANHQDCNLLSPEEKQWMLCDWNKTEHAYNFSKPVHCMIEAQVQKRPKHIAVTSNGMTLTYAELNLKANALASILKDKGVSPGDAIVVYMDRGVNSIASLFAILKLGCVYVPIDNRQPKERVAYMLREVNPRLILSDRETMRASHAFNLEHSNKQLEVDHLWRTNPLAQNPYFPSYHSKKDDLAYIIYTSGSTGKPKGVMISHASLLNVLFFVKESIDFHDKDCLLALAPFSFDISLLEILLPLINGASIVIADNEQMKDPHWIVHAITEHNISCFQATPITWKILFDTGYVLNPSIKVLCGGEPLTRGIAAQLTKAHVSCNLYGPTETTICSTRLPLHQLKNLKSTVSIGKPIANTKLYVLDNSLNPVPMGVVGELYIAGMGVAKGYLQQKDLTAVSFIDNPFETENKTYSTLYKSGDLARWLPDGNLYFVGRADQQFKLRGHRIEAGEIESALLQHPSIKACVVLIKTVNDIDCLIAYITIQASSAPSRKELRAFLIAKVPDYMRPEKFVVIDDIPSTINGKMDTKALLALEVEQVQTPETNKTFILTDTQQALADIWCQVLNITSIAPDDDFYDLGGNSILSLIAVLQINEHFSVNLSIRLLVEHPTLETLADVITHFKEKNSESKVQGKHFSFSILKKIPNPIVTLRSKGQGKPLFLIHPVGGTVFYYIPLVKRLASDRPVYGIQDPGIEAKDTLFSSLSEMADFYISVIKRYQPYGSYYIAGSSFGAQVAFEIARQLYAQKDELAFIGLLDGWAVYPDRVKYDRSWFENNLKMQMEIIPKLAPDLKIYDLLLDLSWHRQQLGVKYHLPKNFPLKLSLLKAQTTLDVLKHMDSPYNHWDKHCVLPPEVYGVPGDHFTMHFEPHVGKFAEVLDRCLNKADEVVIA